MWTGSFFTPGLTLDNTHCVSIARMLPRGWRGVRTFPLLAPPTHLLRAYHERWIGEDGYTRYYRRRVLAHLVPASIAADLGPDSILLCWELQTGGFFCHRRLVAEWLESALGITVPEWPGEVAI